jgi:hypothetical protein
MNVLEVLFCVRLNEAARLAPKCAAADALCVWAASAAGKLEQECPDKVVSFAIKK